MKKLRLLLIVGCANDIFIYNMAKWLKVKMNVSIDVFGESANNYVTAYGQFWPAISNVADVISGMPYPDHFNKHEYGIEEVVWTVPYKLLDKWSKYVLSKQNIIPTPAVVRTWIQTYNVSNTLNGVKSGNRNDAIVLLLTSFLSYSSFFS